MRGRGGARAALAPAPPPQAEPDSPLAPYQRGYYVTAFAIATRRIGEQSDVKGR
jgi:hypothetical protein